MISSIDYLDNDVSEILSKYINKKRLLYNIQIVIQKNNYPLKLIHQLDNSFYATCRTKLGWGSRLGSGNRNR